MKIRKTTDMLLCRIDDREFFETWKRAGRRAGAAALDLLLPRRCAICGTLSVGICGECRKKLPYIRGDVCFCCGRPLADPDAEYCPACRAKKHAYTQGRALYLYTDAVRESLHAVKYHNKREYLEYYAREMAEHLAEAWKTWQPQVMIPIPMHPSACRKRGYNQAEILAKELGRILGIPVRCDVLKKVRKTASQKELDYRARQSNLKGAFAVAEKYMHSSRREGGLQEIPRGSERCLPWERVLLVDDIYTTGSTVHEAAVVLKNAGIKCVYFVTICAVPENS
nr:ComF family protein [uncultured Marvinbryantia sp.]